MKPALRVRIPPPKQAAGNVQTAKPKPPEPDPVEEVLDEELDDEIIIR